MSAIEITGKIIKMLSLQSGVGKNGAWSKQDFIIETIEQYPRKICISAWGDKSDILSQCPVGTEVKVSVNIESREFNDKWYTDVRAWKIEPINEYSDMQNGVIGEDKTVPDTFPDGQFSNDNDIDDLPF